MEAYVFQPTMDIMFTFVDFLTLPRGGLLYDIAGAFVLGYGSLTGKSREEEATLFWKEDAIRRGIIIGKREARVGLGLLGGGFILQLFSGTTIEDLTLLGVPLTVMLVSIVTLYFYRYSDPQPTIQNPPSHPS